MKRLVPRLLAVGVILGMGAISIVQGLGGSQAEDPNNESTTESPSDDASRRDPTPVIAIDAGDNPYSDNSPVGNRFDGSVPQSQYVQYEERPGESRFASTSNYPNDNETQSVAMIERGQKFDEVADVSDPYTEHSTATTVASADPTANESTESTNLPLSTDHDDSTLDSTNQTVPDRVNRLRDNLDLASLSNDVSVLPIPSGESSEQAVPEDIVALNEKTSPTPTNETIDKTTPAQVNETPLVDTVDSESDSPSHDFAEPAITEDTAESVSLSTTSQIPLPSDTGTDVAGPLSTESVRHDQQHFAEEVPSDSSANPILSQHDPSATGDIIGVGKPGTRILEGAQTPSITVEKTAPAEIQIGKPAEFKLFVQNVGQVTANQVIIQDQVPEGTRLLSTVPEITTIDNGTLFWDLGAMEPGEKRTVTLQLAPELEGEIGSVATVTFQAEASVRTVATRPLLAIEHSAPSQVHVGDSLLMTIRVSNPGTGAATNVVLEEDVPDGLSHPAGAALERELGTIQPGETKELKLTLKAEKSGQIENILVARGDANLVAEDRAELEVIAPQLNVRMNAPKKRYLEREVNYLLSVDNPGTAPAKNIELLAHLPKGMKFIQTNNAGQYDPRTHTVYWSLEELPAQHHGDVQLKTTPFEPGDQKLRFEATADLGLKASLEQSVLVDGLASLFFEVADSADPIEVGKETTYEIRLVNEGSKSATDIVLQAILPPGLKPLNADGPQRSEIIGQHVTFQPLARLAPGSDTFYKVQVQGLAAGDQRFRVQVKAEDMDSVITEEEATRVYADN